MSFADLSAGARFLFNIIIVHIKPFFLEWAVTYIINSLIMFQMLCFMSVNNKLYYTTNAIPIVIRFRLEINSCNTYIARISKPASQISV